MTRTLMAAGAALALFAAPAMADPLAAADKRCFNNMVSGDNTLVCAVPDPEMTFGDFIAFHNRMSVHQITLDDIERLNELPAGMLSADAPAPVTMLAIARMPSA